MPIVTKLLCGAAAAAGIAACTYLNLPPSGSAAPVQGATGAAPLVPQFPDHHGGPLGVCPWSQCDMGALFAIGARR